MAWKIYWIIVGLFTQAQGFSTAVVKEGEDAIIECGLQTKVEEGYLKWEAITNDTTVLLAYDLRDGFSNCNDRIINCTIHANGSIQLKSVSKEDGARYYRCLRGDADGYNYYSDHRLLVLSKEEMSSPPSIETPHRESVSSYNMGKKGVLHGYNAPVCEDDVDGNLPVVCYPPSGVIVDREYETIQCNCIDSDGLMDSLSIPVTRQMSSRPSFETPHRKSVSSYNIGKKGVLHGYNAPVCEDDVDGNLPIVCYPPSGVIVERGYETIQCNCTDSDGLMDSVTFPVTSVTHWVHRVWRKASISLLVVILILISIIVVVIWICLILFKILKKSNTNREHAAADPEEMTPVQNGTNDKQISDVEEKIATLEATFSKRSTQSESQVPFLEPLHEWMEMIEKQGTEIENKLKELNEQSMKFAHKLTATGLKNRDLNKLLQEKQDQPQKISDLNQASCEHQFKEEPQGILEVHLS